MFTWGYSYWWRSRPLGGTLVASRPIPAQGNPAEPSAFPPTGGSAIISGSSAGDIWVVCLDEP